MAIVQQSPTMAGPDLIGNRLAPYGRLAFRLLPGAAMLAEIWTDDDR